MRTTLLSILLLVCVATACRKEKNPATAQKMSAIEHALDSFANTIASIPPTSLDLGGRLHWYLNTHPSYFYGATVTLMDSAGKAFYSPYYYRTQGRIDSVSLMAPTYNIDKQSWLRLPIDRGYAVWTEPYFDAGGGEIWMRTRSVPVFINGKIFAVATTDLQVDAP